MGRVPALDYLKILLAVGVVFAHAILLNNYLTEWTFMFGHGVLRSVVPTFTVLSGYFFYSTLQRGKFVFYFRRFALLYVFWTLFYAPLWLRDGRTVDNALYVFVNGYLHLWYVIGMLLGASMLAGLLWVGRATGRGLQPLVAGAIVCAIAGALMHHLDFFKAPPIPFEFYHNGPFLLFPFMAVGYLIAHRVDHRGLDSLPKLSVIAPIAIGLLALKLVETLIARQVFGLTAITLPEFPPLQFLSCAALFVTALRLDLPNAPANLGYLSAMIYFLHIFLQILCMYVGIKSIWISFAFSFFGSMAIALVLSRLMTIFARRQRPVGALPESA